MKSILILLTILLFTTSCAKNKKVEQDLNKQTEQLYQQARSKEAEIIRQEKFGVIERSEEFNDKVDAAIVYFKSFDFQLLSAGKNSNSLVRDRLYTDAVNDFTNRVDNIYNNIRNVKKMRPYRDGKKHNYEQTFYALAVTMHLSPFSLGNDIDSEANNKGLSIYDLIKSALLKDENGEALLDYEERLISQNYKEIMVELIKARLDMMGAMAVDKLTKKKGFSTGQRIRSSLFRVTNGIVGSMDLPENYNERNIIDKNETIIYLDAAIKAKTFLREIGEFDKELEKSISSALENIDFKENGQRDVPPLSQNQEQSDIKQIEIADLIRELIR